MASSSTSKSLDLEKMNLKLKENPFNFVAGGSSSSLKSKDVTKMKNLKIQETVVTPESDSDDEAAAGSPIVFGRTEGGSSSSGKKKAKSQIKRKKVQIETSTATTTRKKTRFSSTTTTSSSTSSSSSSTMVHLRSSDGDIFEVEESIALLSQTITHMIEDGVVAGNVIPLSNISSEILEKVIGFLEKHAGEEEEDRDEKEKEELKKWDENFAEKLKKDQYTLFEMILAANYLSARCLLDVTCQACADMIKGMPPEQIRKFFNIKNDFTPEEEAEVRRENQWAFE